MPGAASRAESLTIGDLSRRTGVRVETIRYYEKIGIFPAPPRTEGGRRVYGPIQTRMLAFIRRARELGFTLDEIRTLLDLGGPDRASCAEVREIVAARLDNVRAKLADLTRLENILSRTVAQCAEGSTPRCPVLDMLDVSSRAREANP